MVVRADDGYAEITLTCLRYFMNTAFSILFVSLCCILELWNRADGLEVRSKILDDIATICRDTGMSSLLPFRAYC